MSSERERVDAEGWKGELPNPSIGVVANALDSVASLERVKEVMRLVAAEADAGSWSTDDEWMRKLPSWFVEPFNGRTVEDVLKDEDLWDFGSWLDAMKQRGWTWWASECDGKSWKVILERHEEVYSIEPLIYLVRQSGAASVEVTEDPVPSF